MEANQFPGRKIRIRIKSSDRFLPASGINELIDVNNKRFKANRRFKSYREVLENDIKNQKPSEQNYDYIGRRIFKVIFRAFFKFLIKDILITGEKFLLPTKYSEVYFGVDYKEDPKKYDLITGNRKYFFRIHTDYLFWMPYPQENCPEEGKYGYRVRLNREYNEMLRDYHIASDWSEIKEEI